MQSPQYGCTGPRKEISKDGDDLKGEMWPREGETELHD